MAVLAVAGCGGGGGSGAGGATASCSPSDPSCLQFTHTYSTQTIAPGQEIGALCQSYTLNNPDEIWVNGVTLDNGGAYHHSNWFFVPNTMFDLPDSTWDCAAQNFDEVSAAVAGGVLFAQSTQAKHEEQAFPAGVAVRIPPWSRIIGETHLLNVSTAPVTTTLTLAVTAIPKAQVTTKLTPFRLTYHDLHIPAQAAADFTASCDLSAAAAMNNTPFSLKLYYVLPHYHKLGVSFLLDQFGGPSDGMMIASNAGFDSEAHGRAFNPPIDVSSDKGFTFLCGYQNPTTSPVGWGIGTQEMCEMLGFADSELAYVATVNDGTGSVTGTSNGIVHSSGPCSVTGLTWDQNKPGGTPPSH
jgi:hypothetical protein